MCYAKLLGHKWWWWQVEWRVFELKCFFNQTKNICFKGPYKHIRAHTHAYVCGVYYTMCTKYIYAQTIGCEVTRIAIMVNCWVRILLARFAVSVVHFCFLCVCRILTAKPGYSNRLSDSETKKLCDCVEFLLLFCDCHCHCHCIVSLSFYSHLHNVLKGIHSVKDPFFPPFATVSPLSRIEI